jgi:hypothetical protein
MIIRAQSELGSTENLLVHPRRNNIDVITSHGNGISGHVHATLRGLPS